MAHLADIVRQLFDLHARGYYCVETGWQEDTDPRTGAHRIRLAFTLEQAGPKAVHHPYALKDGQPLGDHWPLGN